jgi:hypothetical protein
MRKQLAAIGALGLALGACDGGGSQATGEQAARPRENPYQQKLLALEERDRNLALRRAIQDDGGSCPQIKGSTYQQEYQKMAMWVAHCEGRAGRRDWAVYIGAAGMVQARACATARQLGLPECKPEAS